VDRSCLSATEQLTRNATASVVGSGLCHAIRPAALGRSRRKPYYDGRGGRQCIVPRRTPRRARSQRTETYYGVGGRQCIVPRRTPGRARSQPTETYYYGRGGRQWIVHHGAWTERGAAV